MEVRGQLYATAALPLGKEPLVPIEEKAWVGRGAGLDVVVKRRLPSPRRESNPPIMQPVAQSCTAELSRLLYIDSVF
jgi:hypothetical protein